MDRIIKLSIIVPVYNVSRYLKRCLDSFNSQTITGLELIFVNDGSKDNSLKILEDYVFSNQKKIIISKENGGLISAWKAGVKIATGDYVGFVDSDDYIEPEMYETLAKAAVKSDADIIMCSHYFVDSNGNKTINKVPLESGAYFENAYENILKKISPTIGDNYVSPSRCNKIIKRRIINETLDSIKENITSGEDNYATTMWFILAKSFYFENKPLYNYCYNSSSISHAYNEAILDSYITLINDLINFNKKHNNLIPESNLENLFNFYGYLWCQYVAKSNLKKREKKKAIRRLHKNCRFIKSLKYLEKKHKPSCYLYSFTVRTGISSLMLIFMNRLIKKIH